MLGIDAPSEVSGFWFPQGTYDIIVGFLISLPLLFIFRVWLIESLNPNLAYFIHTNSITNNGTNLGLFLIIIGNALCWFIIGYVLRKLISSIERV